MCLGEVFFILGLGYRKFLFVQVFKDLNFQIDGENFELI